MRIASCGATSLGLLPLQPAAGERLQQAVECRRRRPQPAAAARHAVGTAVEQVEAAERQHGEGQPLADERRDPFDRSEEHTSELQSLMRISYAVFCLKKKKQRRLHNSTQLNTSEPHYTTD